MQFAVKRRSKQDKGSRKTIAADHGRRFVGGTHDDLGQGRVEGGLGEDREAENQASVRSAE